MSQPFDFEGAGKTFIDMPESGIDFALITLRPFYQDSLAANGIRPINRPNWASAETMDFQHHAIVGFPRDLWSPLRVARWGRGTMRQVTPQIVAVAPVGEPPRDYPAKMRTNWVTRRLAS